MVRNMKRITPFWGALVLTSRTIWGPWRPSSPWVVTAAVLPTRFQNISSDTKKNTSVRPLQLKNRKFTEEKGESNSIKSAKNVKEDSAKAKDTINIQSEKDGKEKIIEGDDTINLTSHTKSQVEDGITDKAIKGKDPKTRNRGRRLQRTIEQLWRRGIADVYSTFGFVSSSATNLWSDRTQFERLQPTIQAFREYLKTTEIDLEISKAISTRLLGNILVLREIQQHLSPEDRRDEAVKEKKPEILPTEEESYRFMKYATAAYGNNMIRSVQIGIDGRLDSRANSMTRTLVSEHVGVPEEDIVSLDLDHDTEGYHLRHFVAVDHLNKQVVLAIRGTFSFAEIVLDVAAQSRPFCGGEAHAEMANMAERVWEAARGPVMDLLRSNENYDLVLTGHSLGAGTACLLHILCHQEERKLVEGRNVRCFAYATPPVFSPLEFVPQAALKSCTAYIHDRDAVPFLSVDSVRHLLASLSAIGNERQRMSQLIKLFTRRKAPDEKLLKLVKKANAKRLTPKAGAPPLQIPASTVLWIKRGSDTSDSEDDGILYNAKACDPRKLSKMGIFIDVNMLQDHVPSRYEHALHFLEVSDDVKR